MTIKAPYKFDIVGSFLRPEALKKARADFEAGKIDEDELKKVEDKAIRDLVEKEKAAGLRFYTDGEFRRSWWHFDFWWGFEGLERHIDKDHSFNFNGKTLRKEEIKVVGKISAKNHPFLDHFKFLQEFKMIQERMVFSRNFSNNLDFFFSEGFAIEIKRVILVNVSF